MKTIRHALAVAALVAAPGLTPRLSADDFNAADLYEKCVKSAVFIITPMKDGQAAGSGSLIDAERRYVITNYHVVGDTDLVWVQFPIRNKDGSLMTEKKKYIERIPAGQALKGKVLFRDKSRDLALVQLDKLPPDTHAIPLAKKSVRVGETVINIGNPGKVQFSAFSMTRGEVRAVDVVDMAVGGHGETLRIKCKMVVTTNPVNPGDSGGPLIDRRGYQVAVTESGVFDGRTQNVNSFVDVTEVRAFLDEKKITIKELSEEKMDTPHHKDPVARKTPGKSPLDRDPTPGNGNPGTAPPDQGTTPPEKKAAGPVDPAPNAPSPADEKAAETALRQAKVFKDSEDKDYYANKLKTVINKYPGTAAAKEAKKLLDGVK